MLHVALINQRRRGSDFARLFGWMKGSRVALYARILGCKEEKAHCLLALSKCTAVKCEGLEMRSAHLDVQRV